MADNNLLQGTLLAFCESTLNRLLELDPASMQRIEALTGRVLCVSITQPQIEFYLLPDQQGLMLQGRSERSSDCHISGSAISLLAFLNSRDGSPDIDSLNISISGDMGLASQVQTLIADLEIDWEALLSPWTGDLAAHEVGRATRTLLGWGQTVTKSLRLNLEEYLQEESSSLPPRGEVDHFYQQVDRLVLDTDRLAARLSRLGGESPLQNNQKKEAGS